MSGQNIQEIFEEEASSELIEQKFGLPDDVIDEVSNLIDNNYLEPLEEIFKSLPSDDIAELLSKLDTDKRKKTVKFSEDFIDSEVFSYLDEDIKKEVLQDLEVSKVASSFTRP